MTNRDLYKLVRSFEVEDAAENIPTLDEYLRSLWLLVRQDQLNNPTPQRLVEWLTGAFVVVPPPVDPNWMQLELPDHTEAATFEDWEQTILFQIADLHRMAGAGQLDNEYRYFGLTSPSGEEWFNFDTLTYLECAVRGLFGGHNEDEVIVLAPPPEGTFADDSIRLIDTFSWSEFIDLLERGQMYE